VLDLARLLAGDVTEVHAMADGLPPAGVDDADVDGATAVVLRFANGAVGSLVATCLLRRKHRAGLEVYADGLALTLAEDGMTIQTHDAEPRWEPVDPDEAKRAADRAFVDAVLGREPATLVPYAEAHRTHELACAIAESAAGGGRVRVAD
jgi:predicted dehydrogenase